MVPSDVIARVLRTFQSRYPTVTLGVTVGELGVVVEAVANGTAMVGFGGAVVRKDNVVIAERIGESFMIPVAAVDHRLSKLERQLTLSDVRDETQVVVSDVSGLTRGRDFNVLSIKTWRVSEFTTKHQFIRGGLGWGGLPVPMVEADVRGGRLVHLDLPAYDHREYPIYAVTKIANLPGPAARWLIGEVQAELSRFASQSAIPPPSRARSQ
jgi:DNA-binding transcriptional LysR family regulator